VKIIALETSTQPGSIAAAIDGTVEIERNLPRSQKTAESFASELKRMLGELDWAPTDVDVIAVCEGPGSFTGVRIGVTVAKTFAYATGASVVAPSTMRVLACQAKSVANNNVANNNAANNNEVWCVIDAQRREVFASLYRRESQTQSLIEVEPTEIYSRSEWLAKLKPGQIVIGEGLDKFQVDVLSHVTVCDQSTWAPRASALAITAFELHREGETGDAWKLAPKYYRKSAAEEKLGNNSLPTSSRPIC